MTSQHADLLNALDEMQHSVVYALRRGVLANAERLIVELETKLRRRDEREAALVRAARGVIEAHESKWVTVYGAAHDRWNDRFSKLSAALAAYPEVPNG